MQEEMAWKSHGRGPAATKIGYQSGDDGGEKRFVPPWSWKLVAVKV
jgi:hypothetical protein